MPGKAHDAQAALAGIAVDDVQAAGDGGVHDDAGQNAPDVVAGGELGQQNQEQDAEDDHQLFMAGVEVFGLGNEVGHRSFASLPFEALGKVEHEQTLGAERQRDEHHQEADDIPVAGGEQGDAEVFQNADEQGTQSGAGDVGPCRPARRRKALRPTTVPNTVDTLVR